MGAVHGGLIVVAIRCSRYWLAKRYNWMRVLYRRERDWFLYFPFVIAAFGALALTPDTLYALNILPKYIIRSDIFNIFYGYTWFEYMEDVAPRFDWLMNGIGSLLLYIISVASLVFYARNLAFLTKQKNSHA
jgi:hypothetical protein